MATRIQLRRDTAANWTSANPILSSGEFGYETDGIKYKIGDGVTTWSGLDYFSGLHSDIGNLDYASAGHTGFASTAALTSTSGVLQTNIDANTALISTVSGMLDDHDEMNNLDYASAGHTGFQPAGDYATNTDLTTVSGLTDTNASAISDNTTLIATTSGSLQNEIDTKSSTLLDLTDTPEAYDNEKYLISTASGTEWTTISEIDGGDAASFPIPFQTGDKWIEVAPKLGSETYITSLAVFNNKLYGGTNPNGKLLEWNDTDAWVEVAPQLGSEGYIHSLAVFNDKLYGGTAEGGRLYEWNDSNAWVQVAPQSGSEDWIFSLAVFNDKLYGGTGINGKLLEWNGTNAWVEVAPQLGTEDFIYSLAVFNDKLYGGTYDPAQGGRLYEWNGTNAWVEVAPKLDTETNIKALVVFNDKLYGGTGNNGRLYEWNGSNAWVEVASQLGSETLIRSLAVFDDKIYGGTANSSRLYEWNGTNAWVEVAPQAGGTEGYIEAMVVFINGGSQKLYGGSAFSGKLYEWGY